MDTGARLSEEHGGVGSDSDRSLCQIRQLDWVEDWEAILPIFQKAWLLVNGEDLTGEVEIEVAGKLWPYTKTEVKLCILRSQGHGIKVIDHNGIKGLLVYLPVFWGTFAIKGLYIEDEYQGFRLAQKMIDSISVPCKAESIVFQTHKNILPYKCLSHTEGKRSKIKEDEFLTTWIMDWGK